VGSPLLDETRAILITCMTLYTALARNMLVNQPTPVMIDNKPSLASRAAGDRFAAITE
jgi:hypothetical protein